MQPPQITPDQIEERCTERSFTRGLDYFESGAIGNPALHGFTLSATCEGSMEEPYRVSVELMPGGIADAYCTCPYDYEGDCKHIVALLLTYMDAPEMVCSLDTVLATLESKPQSTLLQVISELLKRAPELTPIAEVYSNLPVEAPDSGPLPLVTAYRQQIDHVFGDGFLEQHQLDHVLIQLKRLVQQAESFAQEGQTDFALSMLHALIHESIVRYPDTLQGSELPQFVEKCTEVLVETAETAHTPTAILEHSRMLLQLSFEAEAVFTPLLTSCLEQLCSMEETADLQAEIEQLLDESPDRRAHVQLLLALYFESGRTEDYFRLAQSEGAGYQLAQTLFMFNQDDDAWEVLETVPLSVDEYWSLLGNPTVNRLPEFTAQLLTLLRQHHPDTAIALYQRLIEQTVLSRQREDYEQARIYLIELKGLYRQLDQENQWSDYLTNFRKQHARLRLLLQIIAEGKVD